MSAIENRREVAYRLFAAEFDDATLSYSEGDEERAPNYVVTPTGARVNRLFAVGALTEVESVNEEVLRGRIADPTGAFVTYAGQYQPEAANFLDQATPPMFVSITGKARTYEPDDADRVFTSVRPESINEIDAGTRDRWVVSAARATLERVATMQAASAMDHRGDDLRAALEARGVDESLAAGVPRAIDHYGPTEHYLEAVRTMAVQALELVAGERETVDSLTVAPDETGPNELGPVPDVPAATPPEGGDVPVTDDADSATAETEEPTADATETEEPAVDADDEPADSPAAEPSPGAAAQADATTGETSEPAAAAESSAAGTASGTETPEAATEAETTEPETAETADPESEAEGTADDAASSADGVGDFESDDAGASAEASDSDAAEATDESPTGLGDFDAGESETATDAEPTADAETDADPASAEDGTGESAGAESAAETGDMYEMDDEERAEIEEEFGAEFSTGNEVDDPGEADIDVPDADEVDAEARAETNGEAPSDAPDPSDAAAADATSETDSTDADSTAAEASETVTETDEPAATTAEPDEPGTETTDEPADDVDLEDAVVDVMSDLDDGDGADRDAVVSAIVDRYGAAPDDVEDAIQDALMSGKCYEPNEGTLKSI